MGRIEYYALLKHQSATQWGTGGEFCRTTSWFLDLMFRYSVQWGIITWHRTDISCESTSCFTARTKFEIINMWSSDCWRPFSCSLSLAHRPGLNTLKRLRKCHVRKHMPHCEGNWCIANFSWTQGSLLFRFMHAFAFPQRPCERLASFSLRR